MAQQLNHTVDDNIAIGRAGNLTYETDPTIWRYDNLAARHTPVAQGGLTTPGAGIGVGQIFPVRQEL